MSGWVKLPEEWFEQESVESLPAEVVLLHLSALAYSARHSLDGRVPAQAPRRLWHVADVDAAISHLVTSGFWFPLAAGGWQVRDWQTFILSASEVEHRRQQSRETSERYRRHKAGDHSMCDRCAFVRARDASSDSSGDKSRHASVTRLRTDPTRRGGEESAGPEPAGAASVRLGRATHPYSATAETECCPLPPENPIHMESR